MKTLIGIVSYGNLDFLKLALRGIRETVTKQADVAVVVAKPGDNPMVEYLHGLGGIHVIVNAYNKGFCGSLNDIYDHAFVNGDYDAVIIMGNDVIPYPKAIDRMIECADTKPHEWVAGSQYDAKSLIRDYPEARQFFVGPNQEYRDFESRPWDLHLASAISVVPEIREAAKADVQNLCLFKRSVFEKIGYFDANYAFNSFFGDNDYCRVADLAGVDGCTLRGAGFFHFVSRTIHQGAKRDNDRFFRQNEAYYETKWGGLIGREKYTVPFNGGDVPLAEGLIATPALKISSRANEAAAIAFWSSDAARR